MNPGQESVDEYMAEHYPPCRKELAAYKDQLRAKVMALPDEHHYGPVGKNRCVKRADVLALLDEVTDDQG